MGYLSLLYTSERYPTAIAFADVFCVDVDVAKENKQEYLSPIAGAPAIGERYSCQQT